MESILAYIIAVVAAPLFPGFIVKVKAFIAGKKGPPLLIKYYTLAKLFRKGSVYSTSTSFLFRMGPIVSLSAAVTALLFVPLAGMAPVLSFRGDVIVIFYLMGLGRFFTILAALDTASPFEGMGAAREAFFSMLAEASVFMVIILFYRLNGSLSFSGYFFEGNPITMTGPNGSLLLLVIVSMFMILLAENSRVPVDDPMTHLELTMIHEVMILDHSGPDLALIELGAFCKLLFYSIFITHLLVPANALDGLLHGLVFIAVVGAVYVAVGVIESIMARLKMNLVPKYILTSFALASFAAILTTMGLV
jgi:formate hydrogenlyase subunit 4